MNNKVKTIDLKGKEYAQVVDRLKAFREACPRGKIETKPTITEKHIIFEARVVKDKKDETSAEATGHAMAPSDKKGDKMFEKLETISVGRALAMLGYLASGEIASSEEMEEFYEYKDEKKREMLEEAKGELSKIKTIDELKAYYLERKGRGKEFDKLVIDRKEQLTKQNEDTQN